MSRIELPRRGFLASTGGLRSRRRPNERRSAAVGAHLEQLESRLLLTTLTTLSTSYLDLILDTSGYVTSVVDHRAQGWNLLSFSTPFAKLKTADGTWYSPESATFANNVLNFDFPGAASGFDLQVQVQQAPTKSAYFVFTVNTLSPLPAELKLLNLTTTLTTYGSDFAGMVSNGSFAMYVRSFSPAGVVSTAPPAIAIATPSQMVGASFALGGSDYGANGSGVRSSLKTLITNEGLLTSSVGGPWALDPSSTINRESYLFAFDLGESNVSSWISLAKKGGIGIILVSSWWQSIGHYAPSSTLFPNGVAGMTSVVNQIHAAGLKVGLHTLSATIGGNDSYITPTPDPRLGKDASFTMASGITSSATTIYVNQTIAGLQTVWGSYGGNVLQVDNELIQYTGYTNSGTQHYFTGVTRGAFGTTKASHSSGSTVYHLYNVFELFVADPETTLLDEIGTNLAAAVNLGIDMIYLDALDVSLSSSTYARMKAARDIFEKINHPVRVEAAAWDPYLWTFYSVIGASDYPFWGDKPYIDGHAAWISSAENNLLLPGQLGWYSMRSWGPDVDSLFPDEWEYLAAKAMGNDVSVSFQGLSPSPVNGRQDDYLTMFNKWRTITLDAAMKARLSVPGDEFHLVTLPDGSLHLAQVDYAQQKVTGLSNGSQTWNVNNRFGSQFPTMRIEALYGVGSYDSGSQSLTGSQSDVPPASTVTRAANVTASLTWSTSQARPGQAGSMLFSATNNGTSRTGAWAEAARVYSSPLDIGGNGAIGVWVYGDGKGEILNFQLFNAPGYAAATSEHYVTVDFTGWKYFELPFRETDVDAYFDYTWPYGAGYDVFRTTIDRGHVGGINIYYNNLPVGQTSNTYISLVKALPVAATTLTNPSVTIGSASITFPTSLQSGQYIEMDSMTTARRYDKDGFLIGTIAPTGTLPLLAQGNNTVAFNSTPPTGYNARANVSIASYDLPTVTINRASGQADPTSSSPINFTVIFSEPVSDFATGDVVPDGTAGATTAVVTGSGTTYNVAVSGMAGEGLVIVSLPAGIAHDAAGNPSAASTSTDNMVIYDPTPVTVQSIVVNDGNAQRSRVKSVVITFSELVAMDAGAFEVLNKGTSQLIATAYTTQTVSGKTVVTLTFTNLAQTDYYSLKDGEYQLTVYGNKVHDSNTGSNLDGDNNGSFGGNRVFGALAADKFFRKFGDYDGDRDVDNVDLFRFRQSYLKPSSYRWYFDFDGDGDVDNIDFFWFKQRYLK